MPKIISLWKCDKDGKQSEIIWCALHSLSTSAN